MNFPDVMKCPSLQCQLCSSRRNKVMGYWMWGVYGGCMTVVLPILSWILAQIKPTEQGHCHDGAINLHFITSQVVFATHLPIDVIECLWQFCFTVYMCETLLFIIAIWMLKKITSVQLTLELACLVFGLGGNGCFCWVDCDFISLRSQKFSVAVLPHLTQNLIHMFWPFSKGAGIARGVTHNHTSQGISSQWLKSQSSRWFLY